MNDKKQIEEMANIIADCRFTDPESEAIDLYNAKCRIIPEDSVVLTKEEYEQLQQSYIVKAYDKLRAENKELLKIKENALELLKQGEQQILTIRKETAEKFAEMLKEDLSNHKMDKQKEIEEMAKEIAKRDCYLYDKCTKKHKHNCVSQDPKIMLESSKNYVTIATWLVNANYQKVNENEVVIDKKEYELLMRNKSIEHIQEFAEINGKLCLVKDKMILKEYSPDVVEFIRKEAAKEIYHKIKIKVLTEDMTEDRPQTLYRFTSFDIMKMARGIVEEFGVVVENGHVIIKE